MGHFLLKIESYVAWKQKSIQNIVTSNLSMNFYKIKRNISQLPTLKCDFVKCNRTARGKSLLNRTLSLAILQYSAGRAGHYRCLRHHARIKSKWQDCCEWGRYQIMGSIACNNAGQYRSKLFGGSRSPRFKIDKETKNTGDCRSEHAVFLRYWDFGRAPAPISRKYRCLLLSAFWMDDKSRLSRS